MLKRHWTDGGPWYFIIHIIHTLILSFQNQVGPPGADAHDEERAFPGGPSQEGARPPLGPRQAGSGPGERDPRAHDGPGSRWGQRLPQEAAGRPQTDPESHAGRRHRGIHEALQRPAAEKEVRCKASL